MDDKKVWVEGKLPRISGSYVTNYNGNIRRCNFIVSKGKWSDIKCDDPIDVKWAPDSFMDIGKNHGL